MGCSKNKSTASLRRGVDETNKTRLRLIGVANMRSAVHLPGTSVEAS